jgi:tRNA(adenine34) deaminase
VRKGVIVAESINKIAHDRDVTRHAELVAICEAQATLGGTDLADCTIYTKMEPCAFCSYAIRASRIARVVFSLRSPIMGGASRWNILGDRTLSDSMPEIFAPPPVLVAELLGEEGDAALGKSAPIAWRILRARGLLATPSPHGGRRSRSRRRGPTQARIGRRAGMADANAAQEFLRSLRARQCRAPKKRAACRQWR